jgi:hypothetical protein
VIVTPSPEYHVVSATWIFIKVMKEHPLTKEAYAIADAMYGVGNEIETNLLDEKWRTANKLKNAANDAFFYVTQVVGTGSGQSLEYDCVNARKYLNTLRSMYIFASKQGMIQLDPDLVVRIDALIGKIDAEHELSKKETKRKNEEEIKPWLKKYMIWKEISKN